MADEPTIDELILGIIIVIKILYNYAPNQNFQRISIFIKTII